MTNAVDLAQTGTISSSWRNRIINGGMTISQRTAVNTAVAVTTTASGTFGPDRFWGFSGTASLWNISQVSTGAYEHNALPAKRLQVQFIVVRLSKL